MAFFHLGNLPFEECHSPKNATLAIFVLPHHIAKKMEECHLHHSIEPWQSSQKPTKTDKNKVFATKIHVERMAET
ncbi:MAG: hypothetical protein DBY17_08040 [Oscillospiraceae bacterium]|nr:MAG: hypothetical protein DBY17_08040 [Oscillospiraceae bacterium]